VSGVELRGRQQRGHRRREHSGSRPPRRGLPIQVWTHHIKLPGILREAHHRDVLGIGQAPERVPNRSLIRPATAGEGIGKPCPARNCTIRTPTCKLGTNSYR
jgi:hypothetical protein